MLELSERELERVFQEEQDESKVQEAINRYLNSKEDK